MPGAGRACAAAAVTATALCISVYSLLFGENLFWIADQVLALLGCIFGRKCFNDSVDLICLLGQDEIGAEDPADG